ncbi:ATP-dependent DNA helicase RecQ-like [Acropora palmata]|uniref:ATP-dependent DNA helicase RecQ-like n=1 Tax=Acropora palmata TaxID=6131 RepID=UPI003DA163C9
MVDRDALLRKAVDKVCDSTASLKVEQRDAVVSLLDGHDVLAVLPTGFGKSLIFQAFVLAAEMERERLQTALVLCPLQSIINDQISEARNMGLSASSVADLSLEELKSAKCQLLFGSAEKVLEERLLNVLKDNCSSIHQHLAAIVIDESHTVEMWTGKRSGNKTSTSGFREAFGRLSTLRSFCQQGTPVLAITGTADDRTHDVIIKQLGMKHVHKIYVSPNRPNLRISVVKCKKEVRFKHLAWLVSLLKEKGIYTPKTIIFCNGTLTDIAVVLIHLLLELGEGKKRVVIASTALSMGVNFPDVRYVIHWGPARNLLDYHQESGRGGRDGKQTQVLTIYYGQQVSFCEQDVKNFLQTDGCYRTEAYKPFDKKIQPHQPGHDCCKNCAQTCNCLDTGCNVTAPAFEREPEATAEQPCITRPISLKDREDLRDALNEVMEMIVPTLNLFSRNISHGYANDIVEGLEKKAHSIFTVLDVTECTPLFSVQHALKILEVFNEVFEDIHNLEIMVELFGRQIEPKFPLPVEYTFDENDSDSPSFETEDDFM